MSDDFTGVRETLQRYFDGLYNSDAEGLARVFHPQARYVCATEDALVNLGMEEYLPIVAGREAPAARGEPRRDRVVSIEFAGPKTAFARVHCAIGPKYFTDLLTLIRDGDDWRVISKVFHFELEAG